MICKILESTDGKFIGKEINICDDIFLDDDIVFHREFSQDLGNGYYKYSNVHYSILVKEVIDGEDNSEV